MEITGTNVDGRFFLEKRWNKYYLKKSQRVVSDLIGTGFEVLDLGCSKGVWLPFLRKRFTKVYGCDLIVEAAGYDFFWLCDAAEVPNMKVQRVVSNDMMLHVLDEAHKIDIIRNMYDILPHGGTFIFNHDLGEDYETWQHCSYASVNRVIRWVAVSDFVIDEIVPCCYLGPPPLLVELKIFLDHFKKMRDAKTVYFKLRKP